MITSKKELKEFLQADKIALGIKKSKPSIIPFKDVIWKYQIIYRKYEYARNVLTKNSLYTLLLKYRFEKKSLQLGFSIPINVIDKGLSIAHYGTIVINSNCSIGKNCRIQEGVTIGATNGSKEAPTIGDNVFIGSGTKIIGNIRIANDIAIGAGSVVVKNFEEEGITIAGVPAKKVSNNNSHNNLNKDLFKLED